MMRHPTLLWCVVYMACYCNVRMHTAATVVVVAFTTPVHHNRMRLSGTTPIGAPRRTLLPYSVGSKRASPSESSSSLPSGPSSSSVSAATSRLFRATIPVNGGVAISGVTTAVSATTMSANGDNDGTINEQIRRNLSSSTRTTTTTTATTSNISSLTALVTKIGMIAFIAGMCIALPVTLYPQKVLYYLGLISQKRKERWALSSSQFCARQLSRLIPFYTMETIGSIPKEPEPSIWVCNHTSMLDVFILMAADYKLRGRYRRPIKIVYWKNLEDNPVTRLMFRQAGFIPVAMAPNKPGEDNEYDKASFKTLLKDVKRAFEEDFDVALLPEGQLNPTPELGLQPVFGGAYTLAKMSRRPIYMMALYGIHKLWHPDDAIGMTVTGRHVKLRTYPHGRHYTSAEEFKTTFETVVGQFGATGQDLPEPELQDWLTGASWQRKLKDSQS